MSFVLRLVFVITLFGAISEAANPTECQMWESVSKAIKEQDLMNVTCSRNDLCTGFSCSGKLILPNSVYDAGEVFDFSLEFVPCSFPLVLRIQLSSADVQFMKILPVHGRNEEAILLVIPGAENVEEAYGRLNVAWNAVLKPVKYFVTLEVNFTRIFASGEYPPVQLVPPRSYPVPNCQYERPSDSPTPVKPKQGCVGNDCDGEDEFGKPLLPHPTPASAIDYPFLLKVSIGVAVFLVGLCIIFGIILVCRRRRASMVVQKLEFDEDDSRYSSEDDEAVPASDDKRNLLHV